MGWPLPALCTLPAGACFSTKRNKEISGGESKATGGGGAKYQESNIGGKEEKDNRTSAKKNPDRIREASGESRGRETSRP